jgi:hypothetical protein
MDTIQILLEPTHLRAKIVFGHISRKQEYSENLFGGYCTKAKITE